MKSSHCDAEDVAVKLTVGRRRGEESSLTFLLGDIRYVPLTK